MKQQKKKISKQKLYLRIENFTRNKELMEEKKLSAKSVQECCSKFGSLDQHRHSHLAAFEDYSACMTGIIVSHTSKFSDILSDQTHSKNDHQIYKIMTHLMLKTYLIIACGLHSCWL